MLHALVCVHALLYATAFLFSLRLLALPMGLYFGAVFCLPLAAVLRSPCGDTVPLVETKSTRWRHSPPRVGTVNLVEPLGLYFGAVFFPAPLGCNPFTLWRHSPPCGDHLQHAF